MEALGHLHGAWWQMLNAKEGTFEEGPMTKAEVRQFYGDQPSTLLFDKLLSKRCKALAKLADSKKLEGLGEKLRRYDTKKAARTWYGGASKIETVVHGDFWCNNMMFSDDKDGKPVRVKARTNLTSIVPFYCTNKYFALTYFDSRYWITRWV